MQWGDGPNREIDGRSADGLRMNTMKKIEGVGIDYTGQVEQIDGYRGDGGA